MSISNVKKLRNEMTDLEKESDRYIPSYNYYILVLTIGTLGEADVKTPSELHEISKKMLTRNIHHQPLVSYVFLNNIYLVYSCVDEEYEHYKNGSHHTIISEYVSSLSMELKKRVYGSIIELETKTSVATYFTWKIHSNSLGYMVKVSKKKITYNNTKNKTLGELIIILKENGIEWNDLESCDKYGTFYKLKKKKGKVVIVELSEFFDSRDMKKYINFIFG